MTQREIESNCGKAAIAFFFLAACCFAALMGATPHAAPAYLKAGASQPYNVAQPAELGFLELAVAAFAFIGIWLAGRWHVRRRVRIKAEIYAEARQRSYDRAREQGRARDAAIEHERKAKWHKEVETYAAAHPDEPF